MPNLKILGLTTKCKKLNDKALTGLIVHELCHFSIFQKGTWIDFWKDFFFGNLKQTMEDERETDKLAIRKGYGKEILTMKISAKKRLKGTRWREKFLKRYLTPEEVKDYMRKLQKTNCPKKH